MTLYQIISTLKPHYPTQNCVKNITIGLIGAGLRFGISKVLFAQMKAPTPLHPIVLALSILKSCVVAPILEEYGCRGVLIPYLEGKLKSGTVGKIQAVVLSALIFGAVHFLNPKKTLEERILQVVSSTLSGLIFGTEYVITRNLWASTITHSLHNFSVLTCLVFD